ncbi:MAG: hypothetical protein IJJ33_07650 [Victivallales bacterium]|nr:hypothetical protein [Victivallales bacterium]
MIPIQLQPEPLDFKDMVSEPGQRYLSEHPDTRPSRLPPYWTRILKELWEAYGGICAYLSIYFEYATGAASVDHFVPKSVDKSLAYEWSNYRLSCLGANRRKHTHKILDPVGLRPDSFRLNLCTGRIYPNPTMDVEYKKECQDTINALGLDSPICRNMRKKRFDQYCSNEISLAHIQEESPFIYAEIIRQGLS